MISGKRPALVRRYAATRRRSRVRQLCWLRPGRATRHCCGRRGGATQCAGGTPVACGSNRSASLCRGYCEPLGLSFSARAISWAPGPAVGSNPRRDGKTRPGVIIGGDLFTLSLPGDVDPLPPGMTIIHLDTDPWELGKNYPTEVAILGDPRTTLPELVAAVADRMTRAECARAESRGRAETAIGLIQLEKLRQNAVAVENAQPIHPLALMHAITEVLSADAVVVDEAISSAGGLHRFLKASDPLSYFGNRGGGIGWACLQRSACSSPCRSVGSSP